MRISTFVLILLSGCSLISESPKPIDAPADFAKISYSLYLQRASLTNQEFEQYKALPTGLFMECGTVHRGRARVTQQRIESLPAEQQEVVKSVAGELFRELTDDQPAHYDAPGSGMGLADPGKFILTVAKGSERTEIKTSFDWVEKKQTVLSKKLHAFTQKVRGGVEGPPCGNENFYGVGRER